MPARPILPQHAEFLDEHFGVDPQWKSFQGKLRSKKFVDAVRQDTRSDRKLKRFAKMIGLRQQSKQPGVPVRGDTGKTYKVKYHPEAKRFSCSCKDWTYKRSVRNRGRAGDCKHIGRMKDTMKQQMTKQGSISILRLAHGLSREDKMRDEALKQKITHEAYKRHLPRKGLIEAYLTKSAAEVRGRAASAFLEGLRSS